MNVTRMKINCYIIIIMHYNIIKRLDYNKYRARSYS